MSGSFPSASDYPYTVAQPSPGLPVGNAPPVVQQSDAAAAALAAGARADQIVASDFDQMAHAANQYADHIDTVSAQDALNKIRAAKGDLTYGAENGFMNLKGDQVRKSAADGSPQIESFTGRLQGQIDTITKGLNANALEKLKPHIGAEKESFQTDFARHALGQTEKFDQSVFKDTLEGARNDAIRYSGDVLKLQEIAKRTEVATASFYARQGLKSDAAVAEAGSTVYRSAIETRLLAGDGPGALALYNMTKDKLKGADALVMQRDLKSTSVNEGARLWVQGNGGGGTQTQIGPGEQASRREAMQFYQDNGLTRVQAAGLVGNMQEESRFRTNAINPRDGSDGSDSIGLFQWNGPRYQNLLAFSRANGLNPGSKEAQLKFSLEEFKTTHRAQFDRLSKAGDIDEATDAALRYLTPGIDAKTAAQYRVNRLAFAKGAYEDDTGTQAAEGPPDLKDDTLARAVNAATGTAVVPSAPKEEGPPGFLDTRALMIKNKQWRLDMYVRAQADNPEHEVLAARKQQIDLKYGMTEQGITIAQEKLTKAVEDWVTRGGPPDAQGNPTPALQRPPPEIWNQLSYEKQRSIDATLAHNAKAADPPFTDGAKRIFLQASDDFARDPDAMRNFDMTRLIPIMPKAELQHLQSMKDEINKTGRAPVDSVKMFGEADKSLQLMGVDTRPNAAQQNLAIVADMHSKLLDWARDFKEDPAHPRKPNDDEIRKQIDSMLIQGRTERGSWFNRSFVPTWLGGTDESQQAISAPYVKGEGGGDRGTPGGMKFRFTVPPSQRENFYVPYDKIPEKTRANLENALRSKGEIRDTMPASQRQRVIEDNYQHDLASGRR